MDLKQAAETQFEDSTLDELRQYCDNLGIEYAKNAQGRTLRVKLLKALGEYREEYIDEGTDTAAADAKRLDAMGLSQLNLRSQGTWGGRRRIVQLHRSMDHESGYPQFLAWGYP